MVHKFYKLHHNLKVFIQNFDHEHICVSVRMCVCVGKKLSTINKTYIYMRIAFPIKRTVDLFKI